LRIFLPVEAADPWNQLGLPHYLWESTGYAKNFLEKYNDIALLADLMGHESIETTRIYLRRTASEQQALVDKIVTW
jgi:site-specific recombinase XerD